MHAVHREKEKRARGCGVFTEGERKNNVYVSALKFSLCLFTYDGAILRRVACLNAKFLICSVYVFFICPNVNDWRLGKEEGTTIHKFELTRVFAVH